MDKDYSLQEILTQMESDYNPEHLEAAQKYVAIGGTAKKLLEIIKEYKAPNPNMESMFFLIAGQESDEATQLAWNYLLEKFQNKPDEFEADNFNPHNLLPNNSYLLFSARKYLIISERVEIFLHWAKKTQERCIREREKLLENLAIENDSPDDIYGFNEKCIFDIRFALETMLNIPMEAKKGNLSEDEIKQFSKLNELLPYRYCCKIAKVKNIALLLYHLWLCEFFFPAMLEIAPEVEQSNAYKDIYLSIFGFIKSQDDNLLILHQIDIDFSDVYKRNLSDLETKKAKVDIMFRELKSSVKEYDRDAYLKYAYYHSKYSKYKYDQKQVSSYELYYDQKGNQYFPDLPDPIGRAADIFWEIESESKVFCHDIKFIIYYCYVKDFVLNIINMYQNVVDAYLNQQDNWEDLFIDMLEYLFFQQEIYNLDHSFNFVNGCKNTSKSDEYLKNRFFHYFQKDALFNHGSKEETHSYLIFDLMETIDPDWTFDITKEIVLSGKDTLLNPPCDNYFRASLRPPYEKYCKKRLSKLRIEIGNAWESLCQTICGHYYDNVLTNKNHSTLLPNGTIPDIACGERMEYEGGILCHAKIFIECKKSMYYAEYSSINNSVTDKYINFCDELQYWVLEKPDDFVYPNYRKVKFVFACDFLETESITDEEKNKIQELLYLCKICDCFNFKSASERDLIILIDFFRKNYDFENCKKSSDCIKYVVRQYQKDGKFFCEYSDKKSAALATGISCDAITRCLRNERPAAGGFLWRKAVQGSIIENIQIDIKNPVSIVGKRVAQIDNNGEMLAIFQSISAAAKETHINTKSIRDTIIGRQKSAGGYRWIILDNDSQKN